MKGYEFFAKLSGGSVIIEPVEAEDIEDAKKKALETPSKLREHLPLTHPGEELEVVEIYELVLAATIDFRPRVISLGKEG